MKTKEIEGFVSHERSKDKWFNFFTEKDLVSDAHNLVKAKLIIELPENKVEITESQFDEVCEKFFRNGDSFSKFVSDFKDGFFRNVK